MWRLAFQVIPLLAWAVSLAVVVHPLSLTRRAGFAASALLAAAFSKFALFAAAGGDAFNPDLPVPVILFSGWAYASAMMLTAGASAFSCAGLCARLFRRPFGAAARRGGTAALALLAAGLSAWGVRAGFCQPSVRRVELSWRELPASFDGYRIVHLSDLHCSTVARRPRFERIVESVNSLDADLVAITGDFVDGLVPDRRDDLAPLARLRARDGVVGCTGNHERYWDWPGWRAELRGWGVSFPEETGVRVIARDGGSLAVGAIHDPAFGGPSVDGFSPDASCAFDGAPDGAFRILLFHRPFTDAPRSAEADVRLQLSGHTHGGAMPGVSVLVARANEGRTRGVYSFGEGRYLHLSPGTGQWAGFPLRLFNPSEITEIVLRRAADGKDGS